MPDLADLFPGFQSHWIDTDDGKLFARSGGSGPPLLLIHGFPQTHVMWHEVARDLAAHFTLVIPDLPGYGWSVAPKAGPDQAPYDKRSMARLLVAAMEDLGHVRFRVVGHDRGGRVAYRLALDHPGRVEKLATLDIVPTGEMWAGMNAAMALKTYHWAFLAQPAPMPEQLIGGDPIGWLDWTLASWTGTKNLKPFDNRALAHYRAAFNEPSRIAAMCADYRAGATIDRAHDDADKAAGKRIDGPMLAIFGDAGIPANGGPPMSAWSAFAPQATGAMVASGHFMAEENPAGTLALLLPFLRG
jgi:haloacetate dehalogenase